MPKQNKSIRSNRRKGGGRRTAGLLAVVAGLVILIVAAVMIIGYVTEKPTRPKVAGMPESPTATRERHRLPPRELSEASPTHQDYTGTVITPADQPLNRRAVQREVGAGTLAVIVDDMGKGVKEARALMDIGVPLTFAIIPGLPKVRQVAQEARHRDMEVIIHLPMEPKGYPERRLEENGLLLGQGDDEIISRLNSYFSEVPDAVGANNHMGSGFTESRDKMTVVLGYLKEKGLFFVDSKTSPVSVGFAVAREMGVRAGVRNVFLDNIQEVGYISKQLAQAASIARKRGSAIAICHPHPATLQALSAELPRLRDEGITFVPVSRLVR